MASYPKITPIIANGSSEPRYLCDRFADFVNVKDFGAKGDGETDDTLAFAAAAEAANNNGVYVPKGSYNVHGAVEGFFWSTEKVNAGSVDVYSVRSFEKEKFKEILYRFRVLGQYDISASDQSYTLGGFQGFTIDTKRNKFLVANIGDGHQEIKVLNRNTLAVEASHHFTNLNHANSLCYIPEDDELYVVPLTRASSDNIVIKVLDASNYQEKREETVVPSALVGQFALSYDKKRSRFICSQPCTTDNAGSIITNDSSNYNGYWVRVCNRNLETIKEFIVRAPSNMLFGTGNGAACDGGVLIASSFDAVFVVNLDSQDIIYLQETQVDIIEIEDFEFDIDGSIYCQSTPSGTISAFSEIIDVRNSLGMYNAKSASYLPSGAGIDVDLDTYIRPGSYVINTDGSHSINAPSGINGVLHVERSYTAIKQIWSRLGSINVNDHETFFRTYWNGAWSSWHKFIVDKELYYKPGDTETFSDSGGTVATGWVTSGAKDIYIFLHMQKFLTGVDVTVTGLTGKFRTVAGGYAPDSGGADINFAASGSGYSVATSVVNRATLRIKISKSSAINGLTNNTPVTMTIVNASFSFTQH